MIERLEKENKKSTSSVKENEKLWIGFDNGCYLTLSIFSAAKLEIDIESTLQKASYESAWIKQYLLVDLREELLAFHC